MSFNDHRLDAKDDENDHLAVAPMARIALFKNQLKLMLRHWKANSKALPPITTKLKLALSILPVVLNELVH